MPDAPAPRRRPSWDAADWDATDSEIARRLGVSPAAVRYQRARRGYAPAAVRAAAAFRNYVLRHRDRLAGLPAAAGPSPG